MAGISRSASCLIAACALLMAAACGGSDDKSSKDTGSTAGQLTGRGPITLAQGKDTSGNVQNLIKAWNAQHPKETVRLIELPEDADSQRQQMVQNAQTKSDAYSVLNLDVVWTSEFAANRWVTQLPKDQFDMSKFLPPTVQTATYFNNLYAVPWKTDAGLLYYRKDLLKKAGISEPPKTWAEMKSDCQKVGKGTHCYAGQFDKYEGLTCNVSEAINSAGGVIIDDKGKANVNTPQATQGLDFLVQGLKDGTIPKEAITYQEEPARRAFEKGNLLFLRQWPYQWALSNKKGSPVAGKFDVAPLPGLNGPGAPTLGGHDLAISQFAKNKATALDFIKYLTSEDTEKKNLLASSEAPTLASLYGDPELLKKFPYLPTLKASLLNAKPRPKAVRYGDVTAAIQEASYAALTGKKTSAQALADLQTKLGTLITP